MLNLLRSVKKRIISPATIVRYYNDEKTTGLKEWFAKSLSIFKAKTVKGKEDGILLVQMVKDHNFTIKLAVASKVLADKHNLLVSFYDVTIHWTLKMRRLEAFFDFFRINAIHHIYSTFGEEIGFKNHQLFKDQKFIKAKLESIKKDLQVNGVTGLLDLKFDNILVGDLIYDSYLRFYSKPTIEEINEDIFDTIEIGLNIFYGFENYLKWNKVKCLLTTYVSYIYHGIVARICLERNILVYTLGYNTYLIQKVTKDFPYHQINHTMFSADMELTADQINLAKNKLTSRFSGKIDSATSYMRTTAYSDSIISDKTREQFAANPRNIIIYAHDFYDSPHINRKLQFADFYQYLKEALTAVADLKGTTVFIKVHPNGMPGSKERLIELVESFDSKDFYILDESISNKSIIELKPDLVCTARGTVGIEMAYFKIPSVALFDNIYTNFNFVHVCHDKESYFSILRGESDPVINFDKGPIYKFYYQAYLDKIVKEEHNILAILESFKGVTYSDDFLTFLSNSGYMNARKELLNYYSNALAE